MVKIHCVAFLVCVLVRYACAADISGLDDEMIDICLDVNLDAFCFDYSNILDSPSGNSLLDMLQENQTPDDSYALEAPVLSNALDSVGINEGSSVSFSLSSPSTSASTIASTSTCSSIPSVQGCFSAGSAKRACDMEEKKDREQMVHKRQKTNTILSEANTGRMDKKEVCLVIEEFNRYFMYGVNVWVYIPLNVTEFAKNIAQRGLTSAYSKEIIKQCTASKEWLGHKFFWRVLIFFLNTLSLDIVTSNQLEDKNTIILKDRKIRSKLLLDYTRYHMCRSVSKCQGATKMEINCSLNILEDRSTADVFSVLRWLLYHVNIGHVSIVCDLTKTPISSNAFGRQIAALTKNWKGSRLCIDSLTLHFVLTQHMNASAIVKEFPSIPALKIYFRVSCHYQFGDVNQALKALLLNCPALEQLNIFGVYIGIGHIQMIVSILPKLVLLEVESLNLDMLQLCQRKKEERERETVSTEFPSIRTLKLLNLSNYKNGNIERFVGFFPSLNFVKLPTKYVSASLINAFSRLPYLRSLKIIDGLLLTETAVFLIEKLPNLETLCLGVKKLDAPLLQAFSKCTTMHILQLRGHYNTGFLSSLVCSSPLMNTLKVLDVYRYSKSGTTKLTPKDLSSKKTAMNNFGCVININR
ncbi:hypothetical protein NECID01_0607 [Nematocida sp. AWRm77]|nr:hypothetical protein NECID01_0607 [Nematocida sp. AWRm77]